MDGGWKLFYSGADPSMSAQAGVGILTFLGCLTVYSIGFLWDHATNATSEYQAFVDDVNDALQKVGSTESTSF